MIRTHTIVFMVLKKLFPCEKHTAIYLHIYIRALHVTNTTHTFIFWDFGNFNSSARVAKKNNENFYFLTFPDFYYFVSPVNNRLKNTQKDLKLQNMSLVDNKRKFNLIILSFYLGPTD